MIVFDVIVILPTVPVVLPGAFTCAPSAMVTSLFGVVVIVDVDPPTATTPPPVSAAIADTLASLVESMTMLRIAVTLASSATVVEALGSTLRMVVAPETDTAPPPPPVALTAVSLSAADGC